MPGRIVFTPRGSSPPSAPRTNSFSTPSRSSSVDKAARSAAQPNMDHLKKAGIGGIKDLANLNKAKKKGLECPVQKPFGRLDLTVESPSILFYGPRATSTGARFSGIVELAIDENEPVSISKWTASVCLESKTSRPVHKDCPQCANRVVKVHEWNFASEHTGKLAPGKYKHHVNPTIKGDMPATTHIGIGAMVWVFRSTVESSTGQTIVAERSFEVHRALYPGDPEQPHRITREFPGSNFIIHIHTPRVAYQTGELPLNMTIENVAYGPPAGSTRRASIWRVHRTCWELEEETKVLMAPCDRHRNQPGSAKRSALTEGTRSAGSGTVHWGTWKYDHTCDKRSVDPKTSAAISGFMAGKAEVEHTLDLDPKFNLACDVDTPHGLSVSHTMIVDIIISEYVRGLNPADPEEALPTGQARQLRAKFNLIVTSRQGEGVSWDLEAPPPYSNVPPSPPGYMVDVDHAALEQAPDFPRLDATRLGEPSSS